MPNGEHLWKTVGLMRKFLADELAKEKGRNTDAAAETVLALKAFRQAATLAPGDLDVQKAIRELSSRR